MSTISALKWIALTTAINRIKTPNTFLQKLLYPNHQTLPVEDIELSVITGERVISPFVRRGSEAILVNGTGSKYMTVAGPNIRIKMPFNPSPLLFGRQPGTAIQLPLGTNQMSAVDQLIARDLTYMQSMIDNAVEYLVGQSLQGSISYTQEDEEVITITIPRPSANNIVLSTFWDQNGAAPFANFHTVKELNSDAGLPIPTDCVLGSTAAHTLMSLVEAGTIKLLYQIGNLVDAGQFSFVTQFQESGAIYLGTLGGIRIWQYSRTATLKGASQDMIRPKYAEFFSTDSASARTMFFAAIPDIEAMQGGQLQSERFSKSWIQKDPSVLMALVHSRPLPWPQKPDANTSMKVVSG